MKKKIYVVTMLCLAVICAGSIASLFYQRQASKESAILFRELSQTVNEVPKVEQTMEKTIENTPTVIMQTAEEKYSEIYERNHDFMGWIKIEDTKIDYPVMQKKEEKDYYLKRNFEKKYSSNGVPYVAETCDMSSSDNLVIHGHHMKDGSMFADLCSYENEEFYKQHRIIHFDTLHEFAEYEIIAVFKTVVYKETGFPYYAFTDAENEAEFDEYIKNCKKLALYDVEATAQYGDRLITLSTCEYSKKNGRIVIVAKKIKGANARVLS